MPNFAVFVSGYGRGAIEIIRDQLSGELFPVLKLILSTNPDSYVLKVAQENNIETTVVYREGKKRKDYENLIIERLTKHEIDYIFLAGYFPIVGSTLLKAYPERILNVHPSLLPAFKGINAIDQAINYGVKIAGVTVHIVNEEIDGGIIIGQEAVRIEVDDTFNDVDRKIFVLGTKLSRECINSHFLTVKTTI